MTEERFFELVYAWRNGGLAGYELYQRVLFLSEHCSGCEESTGETKLLCCNHCGRRVESF